MDTHPITMRHARAMETPEERVARLLQRRVSLFHVGFIPCIWLQKRLLAAVTKTTHIR